MSKKEKSSQALDVGENASTHTIKVSFRRKAKALQSGGPVSKKTFEELNAAYQFLMQDRAKQKALGRKKVTILSSDVAEFSRMMATAEQQTLDFFNLCKEVFEEKVENSQGRIFNTAGDAILAEFEYPYNAVHCAVEIQKELRALNLGQPEGYKINFRMGLNMGEVFVQDGDLLGDAVNIAARIQTSAKPGGICISGGMYEMIRNRVTYGFVSLGNVSYKNIPEPVPTYAVTEEGGTLKIPTSDTKLSQVAVPTAKSKSTVREVETGTNPTLKVVAGVLVFVAAGFLYKTQFADTAGSKPKQVSSQVEKVGHLWVAITPDSHVTFSINGQQVFQGNTPIQNDFDPGTYKMHIDNANYGISEDVDITVRSGESSRYERVITGKKLVAQSNGTGTEANFLASGGGGAALTQLESDQKQKADQNNDSENAFRFAMSRLAKEQFEEAYMYFRIAAKSRNPQAEFELGKLFYQGKGAKTRDFDAALYWLVRASLDNVPDAARFLWENKFPKEYELVIKAQQKIANGDVRSASLRQSQETFLEGIKEDLEKKGLPN